MKVLETDRLQLRWMEPGDAGFILELMNDPTWISGIGDRGIRTIEAARDYITTGPLAMCARLGFGLYLVERKESPAAVGICGLIQREGLDGVDLGFAMLRSHQGQGFTSEAAAGVMEFAAHALGLTRLLAITRSDNGASIHVLEKLGFSFERMAQLAPDVPAVRLYARGIP